MSKERDDWRRIEGGHMCKHRTSVVIKKRKGRGLGRRKKKGSFYGCKEGREGRHRRGESDRKRGEKGGNGLTSLRKKERAQKVGKERCSPKESIAKSAASREVSRSHLQARSPEERPPISRAEKKGGRPH